MISRFNNSVAASAIAISFMAAPAFAQESVATARDAADSNVIIVTAQKREENIQEVPISISAVGRDYLQSRDISSITDLGSLAPNVKFERAPGSATTAQVSIRGSVTINPAITWEPAVGIYLDGVYIAKNTGAIFDVADLERVEVLRGPQGTLYGRNTLAGAINLVTAKPTGEFSGSAEITYGNYDYWRGKAVLNLPAIGPFSVKLSGQVAQRDGFFEIVPNPYPAAAVFASPPQVNEAQSLDNKSFMAQVRFEPADNVTFDYSYDYSKYNQTPLPGQLLKINLPGIPLGPFANPNRQDQLSLDADIFEKTRTYGHALTATLDLGAAELKSVTAYRDVKFQDRLDLDGSTLDIATTARFTDMSSFSQELQLAGSVADDRIRYVLGGFYYDEKASTNNPQRFFGIFGPFGSVFDSQYSSKTEAWAVYGQVDFEITDALSLTLGGRYTEETKSISRFLQNAANPLPDINIAFGDVPEAKYDDFSPSATLAYQINPDLNIYARYAKGFKSGGFNGETNQFGPALVTAQCPTGTPELCNPYQPETVDSYEVGVKSVLADGALTLNVSAFYDEHQDIQLSVFDATGAASSTVLNAASATIKGIEIETIIRPADWFTINGSIAYLDAEYNSFIEKGIDVSNNRAFPQVPSYTASLGMDWRVAEGEWGRFNLLGDLSMVSKYYTFPYQLTSTDPTSAVAGASESPGRVLLNLRATVSDIQLGAANFKLSGWVRNVTNENAPSNFIDFGPSFGGLLLGYYPDPRTYGLTLGAEF